MKILVCGRCEGVFSKGMNIEKIGDGKEDYHTYCASVERKERQDEDFPQQEMRLWFPFFWPMLLLPILKIRG